jgi:hypothetical protein
VKKGSKKLGHGSQLHVTISSNDKHKKKRKKKVVKQEEYACHLPFTVGQSTGPSYSVPVRTGNRILWLALTSLPLSPLRLPS